MKKKTISLILLALVVLGLVGCGKKEDLGEENNLIRFGVSPEPHRDIAELIVEDLKQEGIDLEIIEFQDYVIPNRALDSKEIDANFFQHLPYLEDFASSENLALVSLGPVHVEPMAVYSEELTDLKDLEEKALVGIPNDPVNGARALLLLEDKGLISLKEGSGIEASLRDIEDNPHKLNFKEIEAASLPRTLKDLDLAVINGNYALGAGLNPVEDSLLIEGSSSPYGNIVAIREEDQGKDKYVKLLEALQSEKVRSFIEEKYEGAVVPAF